jgi:hypothetical protein
LNHSLPGFSEANWTSQFRRYAGLSNCEEGISDFFYDTDVPALLRLFKLQDSKGWKRAFIEVKAKYRGDSPRFRLTGPQFQKVLLLFSGSEQSYRLEDGMIRKTYIWFCALRTYAPNHLSHMLSMIRSDSWKRIKFAFRLGLPSVSTVPRQIECKHIIE